MDGMIITILDMLHGIEGSFDPTAMIRFADESIVSFRKEGESTFIAVLDESGVRSWRFSEENEVLTWWTAFTRAGV